MILQSLCALADRQELVDDPAFERKAVRWIISLDSSGQFLDALDTRTPERLPEGSKKKPRMQAKLQLIPRRVGRSSGIRADFLVDNAKYALGLAADGDDADDPRLAQCHEAFVKLLRSAPQVPEMQATLAFLSSEPERSRCAARLAEQGGFASNDLFCFEVDGFALTQVDEVSDWWSAKTTGGTEEAALAQCLVCGQERVPARLHNSFQIRGASTSGIPLVSFNAGAFEKYGWSKNENAPVCSACMTSYTEALRRLTRPQYETPQGLKLHPLSTTLNGDTTAIYWSDGPGGFEDAVSAWSTDPKSVGNLLNSPHKGQRTFLEDPSRFFCLILTGAQGRASVQRLHIGTVAEVAHNLQRYFSAVQIGKRTDGAPLPLSVLLRAIVFNGELDRLPAQLGVELWMAALFGFPLSRAFLAAVVTRNRLEQENLKLRKWKVGRERAALLQFYFVLRRADEILNERQEDQGAEGKPSMGLNDTTNNRAYVFGRILATAERMQGLAQPQNLNRTLVDRFFGMASVRPQVVYDQLLVQYQYHRRKALRDIEPLARSTDTLWSQLQWKLDVDDAFSKPFGLEDQARFGLGYYHQKQDFMDKAIPAKADREERARNKQAESAETDADVNEEISE